MTWIQKEIVLRERPRGFHLITHDVLAEVPEISRFRRGLLHLFLQHTSASLGINENADPTVRNDLEQFVTTVVPDGPAGYAHDTEGADDMPAHIKSALLGCSLMIPIAHGRLALGTWQGIYLGEHRDHGGPRHLLVTLTGEQ